jgi:hypothetical protein
MLPNTPPNNPRPATSPINTDQILQALKAIAAAMQSVATVTGTVFPTATASVTSATGGSASALPSPPAGYLVVTLPGGGVGKVPYYN